MNEAGDSEVPNSLPTKSRGAKRGAGNAARWNSPERNRKLTAVAEAKPRIHAQENHFVKVEERKRKNERFLPRYGNELLDSKGHVDVVCR